MIKADIKVLDHADIEGRTALMWAAGKGANDVIMGLRRLRSGNARLVLGTSLVWVLLFLSTKDYWCHLCSTLNQPHDTAAVGNLPARKTLFENIGEGFENVQRGEYQTLKYYWLYGFHQI